MPYFAVDDQITFHPKFIAAGNAAIGVWSRAGAWAKAHTTGGFVSEDVAHALGKKESARLVAVGLWVPAEHAKYGVGYAFHDWTHTAGNGTEEEEKTRRDKERERARDRKRAQREREAAEGHRGSHAVTPPVVPPTPSPSPIPTADVTSSHGSALDSTAIDLDPMARVQRLEDQAILDAQRLRIKDMPGVRWLFEQILGDALTFGQVIVIAEAILGAAKGEVASGDAYLRTVTKDTPAEIRRAYNDLHVEAVR
jgi:hypothetical protein